MKDNIDGYGFSLRFSELDEDLQEQKIDEVIQYNHRHGEYTDRKIEEVLEDEKIRSSVRNYIESHFPLYF